MILPVPKSPLSFGETRFILSRALVGLGASYTIGEYFSESILWLQRRGWHTETIVLQLLQDYTIPEKLTWQKQENPFTCPITAGLALGDQIQLNPDQPACMYVKHPLLLIALIGKSSADRATLMINDQNVWEMDQDKLLHLPEAHICWRPGAWRVPEPSHPQNRLLPNPEQWAVINAAFAKTLVPEDADSRDKAGAQDANDND